MNSQIERKLARLAELRKDRNTFETHWRDIADFLAPYSSRFVGQNAGQAQSSAWQNILDSRGTRSGRILAAGMMAGVTSPARPWFQLMSPDPEMMKYAPVRDWLEQVESVMRNVFAQSNVYRVLHRMYLDLAHFGTATATFDDDYDNVIHLQNLLLGQYFLATDSRGRVSTLYREFQMTVEQIVEAFGIDNCSTHVKGLYKRGALDTWIDVVHVLEPRVNYDTGKIDNKNMPFASCYFEAKGNADRYLGEGGMKRFRAISARWDVAGTDAYGYGPGSEALGYAKQLQQQTLVTAEATEYQVRPPLRLPTAMKGREANTQPGGRVYSDSLDAIKPLWDVRLDTQGMLGHIQDTRAILDSVYYADLFLMISNDTRNGVTAREIVERHEEKLLMIGPVLERLHNEMLSPLIDLTFDRLQDARTPYGHSLLPPAPKELQGLALQVQFVSTLAQAQRAIGVTALDKYAGMVAAVAQVKPEILDKFDSDKFADNYGEMLGVTSQVVVPAEKVEEVRKGRAQQAQAQQMAAMAQPMQQAAQAAKTAGGITPDERANLSDLANAYMGYAAPTPAMPQGGQ